MGIKKSVSTTGLERYAKYVPFSPNTITFFSLLLALIGAYFIFISNIIYSIPFILLALLLDGVDGIVARAKKQSTKFGAYLDGISDRIVEFAILAAMTNLYWPNPVLALCSLLLVIGFGTFLTSFSKAYADHRGAISKKDVPKLESIFERTERSLLIFASLFLYLFSPTYSMYLLSFTALLSVIAFLQRFLMVASLSGFFKGNARRK
jgi:phosphatidylglycerophosphate synthase